MNPPSGWRKAKERAAKLSRAVHLDDAVVSTIALFPTMVAPPSSRTSEDDALTRAVDDNKDHPAPAPAPMPTTEPTASDIITPQSVKSVLRKPKAQIATSNTDDDRSVGSLGTASSLRSIRITSLYPKIRRVHLRVVARAILASHLPPFGNRVAVDAVEDAPQEFVAADAFEDVPSDALEGVVGLSEPSIEKPTHCVECVGPDPDATAVASATTPDEIRHKPKKTRSLSLTSATSKSLDRLLRPTANAMRFSMDHTPLDTSRTTLTDVADGSAHAHLVVSEVSARLLQGIGHFKLSHEKEDGKRQKRVRRRRLTKQTEESAGEKDLEGDDDDGHTEVDMWATPDGQPWCPNCHLIFRSKVLLERHKYSRMHETNLSGGSSLPGSEYDEGGHYKLMYSGSKLFVKPLRVRFDVDVFEHVPVAGSPLSVVTPVVEIVLYEPREAFELPRIYLDLGPQQSRVRQVLEDRAAEVAEDIRQAVVRKSKYNVAVDVASITAQERLAVYSDFVLKALRVQEVGGEGEPAYRVVFQTMRDPSVIARSCASTEQLADLLRDVGIAPPTTADGEVDLMAARAAVPSLVMHQPPNKLRPAQVQRQTLTEGVIAGISQLEAAFRRGLVERGII